MSVGSNSMYEWLHDKNDAKVMKYYLLKYTVALDLNINKKIVKCRLRFLVKSEEIEILFPRKPIQTYVDLHPCVA